MGLFVCGGVQFLDTVLSEHFLCGVCFHIVQIGKVFFYAGVEQDGGCAGICLLSDRAKGLERQALCCHGFQFSSACLQQQGFLFFPSTFGITPIVSGGAGKKTHKRLLHNRKKVCESLNTVDLLLMAVCAQISLFKY